MGLSIGWGDKYGFTLPNQWVDITGLAEGDYRLKTTADASNWFIEGNNSDNATWVDLRIEGTSVTVLEYGPFAQKS